jgi:hypothetical protein
MSKSKAKPTAAPAPAKKGGDGGRITKPGAKVEKSKAVAKAAVVAAATKKGVLKPSKVNLFPVLGIVLIAYKEEKKKPVKEDSDGEMESSEEDSSEEEENSSEEESSSNEESDSDEDSDEEEEAKPAPKATTIAWKKPAAKAESSEEDSSEEEDSDEVRAIWFLCG